MDIIGLWVRSYALEVERQALELELMRCELSRYQREQEARQAQEYLLAHAVYCQQQPQAGSN